MLKESCDSVCHHYDTALVLAFVHTALVPGLNPAMLLGPRPGINPGVNPIDVLAFKQKATRQCSSNFPGPTCSVKGS